MRENSKIKVLFVIDTLEGYGAEKSLVEISKNFNEVLPIFVHIYKGEMLKPNLEGTGIKVYSLNMTNKYGFRKAVNLLQEIYLEEKPHFIHATLYRSEIVTRKLKTRFPEIKLIGSMVSNAYSDNRYLGKSFIDKLKLHCFYLLDRKTLGKVNLFISNSHTIKATTCKALKIPNDKVKVIYRGRDKDNYSDFTAGNRSPGGEEPREIILLNVSRLIPLKGQLDLIKALPKVIHEYKNIKLNIAGDGYYKTILENEIRLSNLEKHVTLIGRTNKVQHYLKMADIFVYPSYSEGLPGALIEAMMAGKIIIASNIPENLECVSENSAIIFKKGEIDDLAEKIIKVISNIDEYYTLGETAQKVAFKNFDVKEISKKYEAVYRSLN